VRRRGMRIETSTGTCEFDEDIIMDGNNADIGNDIMSECCVEYGVDWDELNYAIGEADDNWPEEYTLGFFRDECHRLARDIVTR